MDLRPAEAEEIWEHGRDRVEQPINERQRGPPRMGAPRRQPVLTQQGQSDQQTHAQDLHIERFTHQGTGTDNTKYPVKKTTISDPTASSELTSGNIRIRASGPVSARPIWRS